MRNILLPLLLFFSSCSSFTHDPQEEAAKAQALRDSIELVQRLTRLEERVAYRDALLLNFTFERSGYSPYYSHDYWNNTENFEGDGLHAMVDEDVTLTVVSRLRRVPGEAQHNRVDLVIADSVFSTGTTGFGSIQELPGEDYLELASFPVAEALMLGSVISRHLKDSIEVRTFFDDRPYGIYTMGYEEKKAIYDCVQLANTLTEIDSLLR